MIGGNTVSVLVIASSDPQSEKSKFRMDRNTTTRTAALLVKHPFLHNVRLLLGCLHFSVGNSSINVNTDLEMHFQIFFTWLNTGKSVILDAQIMYEPSCQETTKKKAKP